jgi:hypothetical protein
MQSVSTHFNEIASYDLTELDYILSLSYSRISFWGGRVISVRGYKGSVSLNAYTKKALNAIKPCSLTDNLSTEDRILRMNIIKKLQGLYGATDSQVNTLKLFTWSLFHIREISGAFFSPRLYLNKASSVYTTL